MPTRIRGISNLIYSDEEMAVAGLTSDGKHVQAWVMVPRDGVWHPEGGDMLWLPPNATKSTDLDSAGRVVDVTPDPGEMTAWVTTQLALHNRYLDTIRDRVRAGRVKLTAFLAKMLGLPFDEDGVEMQPRSGSPFARPTLAEATKAMQSLQRAAGLPIDPDTGLSDIGAKATDDERVRTVAAAASERYAQTGDISAALDELMAGIARTRPGKVA